MVQLIGLRGLGSMNLGAAPDSHVGDLDSDNTRGSTTRQGSHCTKMVPVKSHNDFSRLLVEKGVV